MASGNVDDRVWFSTYKHELCCDTCPNDDVIFIQMIKDARQEGAEMMRQKIANVVANMPYGVSCENVLDVKWEDK